MSAFAVLTLQNSAAANVTFSPLSREAGVAKWVTNDAVFDAKSSVTMSVTYPKAGSSVVRIKQKVVVPIMDPIDASKKVAEAYVNIEAVLPKNSSDVTRLTLRKYADTLLQNAVSTAAFTSFENITG